MRNEDLEISNHDFDEQAVVIKSVVATSDNVGTFLEKEETPILDFPDPGTDAGTMRRGHHYVLVTLRNLPQ